MPRPAKLPLPADQEEALIALTSEIDRSLDNRAFLDAFLPVLYSVTGEVFGASLIRRLLAGLLKDVAGARSPAQPTVHAAIQRFAASGTRVLSNGRSEMNGMQSIDGRDASSLIESAFEMVGLHRLEVERERGRADKTEQWLEQARNDRDSAKTEAAELRANLAARNEAYEQLVEVNNDLRAALQLAVDRAASENRENMRRVDLIRQETRLVEEKLRSAEVGLQVRQKELRDANVLIESLRRQVSNLRANGGAR
jgi:hypothetical protein